MIVKTAEFVRSAKLKKDYINQELPEIAIVGKSNVGKSSLINALTNNSKLARVSKQPGKTRLVNFFLLNQQFYLVDLPGYGFARVSKAEKETGDERKRKEREEGGESRRRRGGKERCKVDGAAGE